MFKLYAGLVRDGKWYNHAKILDVIKGGMFAIMGGNNIDTGADKVLKLLKASVHYLYTKDGEEYKLNELDYLDFLFIEGWKVGREVMKKFSKTQQPVFSEYFFCPRCSTEGDERYTEVRESWDKLIIEGLIDENYIEDPEDLKYEITLEVGIELPQSEKFQSGIFKTLTRKYLTIGDQLSIYDTPECIGDYSRQLQAKWDKEIVAIKGLGEKDLNHYKRRLSDSFCERFLVHQEDIDIMASAGMTLGIDARDRVVTCKSCHHSVGGSLDFTNFFAFLLPKKLNPVMQQSIK
ncbi:MAG: hypothetical protein KAS32_02660 [Candidatus Peribacteraceae bacterium]|nr:hypothetical protein [Candidatus Peribacteraceae bacterium]